ncbi:uncharacterized protein TRIADDRAFT_61198 [Trichoplax adhaerens]|uniref:Uncharacterized protein n=1 Tax=Trichoplax adhaerens TaxID=10228 RepID=B3SAA9_TRIAD|nr:predicted protein [Trichoplax adhaerens]EDV20404.1 predicted protein [Trichoplax adhaerens]|eukprot:XP_002117098.1 predicted protein [Trichoplax adhaerens]
MAGQCHLWIDRYLLQKGKKTLNKPWIGLLTNWLDMENYYDQVVEDLMMRNRTRTLPSNLPNNISDIICKKRRHASFTTDINDRYDDEKEISYDKEDPALMDDFSFDETAF